MQIFAGAITLSSRTRDGDLRTIEWEVTAPPVVAGLKFIAAFDVDNGTLIDYASARIINSRPCTPPPCPPLEEVEISAMWHQSEYESGAFAREVEEFYGGPIT